MNKSDVHPYNEQSVVTIYVDGPGRCVAVGEIATVSAGLVQTIHLPLSTC
jgi:hypothetical protein